MEAIDRVIKRAVVAYCKEQPRVSRYALERYVDQIVRHRCCMYPEPGHVWCVFKDLVRHGFVTGMWNGDEFGVQKARLTVTKKKYEPKRQIGFGFGEK